jgi:hypothetical protein
MLLGALRKFRIRYWKRRYRTGRTFTRFIAPDIRREIEIIDTSHIESGVISARVRTWNVLYAVKGIKQPPPFDEPRTIEIKELWKWTGKPWGGPVPKSPENPGI